MNVLRKHYKWIALLIVVALIAESFVYVLKSKAERELGGEMEAQEDRATAADISNMTGATTEDVMQLKQSGLNWNEVLERLKQTGHDNRSEKEQRSALLAGTGLEETMTQLEQKGFTQEEITEARMLAERVEFQLKEVGGDRGSSPTIAASDKEKKGEEGRLESIASLAEQFILSEAFYDMVVLKKELGSYEAVLDEYLLSLQLGISLQQYVSDKEAYLKAKQEKSTDLSPDEIVTAADIEMVLLEKIQQNNRDIQEVTPAVSDIVGAASVKDSNPSTLLPDVPQPAVDDVKPENPADQVMREIQAINPNR